MPRTGIIASPTVILQKVARTLICFSDDVVISLFSMLVVPCTEPPLVDNSSTVSCINSLTDGGPV